jgi:fibronectin-binding autotransporter adhesin
MKNVVSKAIYGAILLVFVLLVSSTRLYATKYYSYQSGTWNGTNVWTTDSTGSTLLNTGIPASNDIIGILTGRTITVTANITTTGHVINMAPGSVLDLTTMTIPAITLNGNGLLRTSRVSSGVALLPTITTGNFFTQDGGTVEYYVPSGNCYIDDNILNYNNLLINLGSSSQILTLRHNLFLFGYMDIQVGAFQINNTNTTKLTIEITGDLTVESGGKILTGTGNTNTAGYSIASATLPPGGQFATIFHELIIGGNFTNYGSVRFTNLTYPNYGEFASNGAVTVRFTGESNITLSLNGLTDFYNLIIDKGSDQNYLCTIYSSGFNNFALFGPNAVGRNEASPFTPDNPEVRKALWIRNGTLKLTGKLLIPSLTEGRISSADGNGDYPVGSNAQLWIADDSVSVYSTATTNTGFPEAPVGSSGVRGTTTDHQAISIYGKLRISAGYLSTRHSAGIIFWNTVNSNSAVIVEGGTINASVMRSTYTADGRTSYLQTGGTVIVRGNETEAGEMYSGYPIFSIPNPNSSFVMSGGEIIIKDKNGDQSSTGNGIYLNCDPGNYEVTGGTITIQTNPANTPSFDINTRVPLWNLNVKNLTTSGNSIVEMMSALTVSNSLYIYANATLNSSSDNYPVTSLGDFKILTGGTYTPNANATNFTGTDNYFLWNQGTITNGLYDVNIQRPDGSLILVSSSNSFTIRDDLTIIEGILADGGTTVYVAGDVINYGMHQGAGKISLNGSSTVQAIIGNGQGVFQNLEINNSYGSAGSAQVSVTSDIQVTGNLTLANDRLLDISTHQVSLASTAKVLGTMSTSRFIRTSGNASDGGIVKTWADTSLFTFPMGTGTNYTPVTIYLKKIPTAYGSVSVRPVPSKHPFATNTSCLATYWKVIQSGFQGIQASSVKLIFNYGNLADNTAYVPGKYNPAEWTYANDITLIDESANNITFPGESTITGDYTAGIPAAFSIVTSFYSRTNGDWSNPGTWSNVGFGGSQASTIPGASNPVFIGDGDSYFHTVTVSGGSAQAGSLSLQAGSVLVLGNTTGNNFGVVLPESKGKIRITASTATAIFPAGDFGNFLGTDGGTVEYYQGTTNFTLPTISASPSSKAITSYYQLILAPATGYSVTMPDADLTIYSDMTVQGASSTALAKFNTTSSRTLSLKSNLNVNSGNLLFQNTTAQKVVIDHDISVSSGAIFNIATNGTSVSHTLTLGGNLNNDGTLDFSVGSSTYYHCDLTSTSGNDAVISGRGATTDLYSLTLNKGTDATPVLNVTSSNLTFNNNTSPVTLVHGTFRLTSAISVTISSGAFSIPATTCLSANGGTFVLATNASDNADLKLAGMLEVKAGGVTIGNSSNSNNNDIEYAGAGDPTIEVRGGALFVNGQIRRSLINGLGSLIYKQSGSSTVTINGRNAQAIRAKLEVLNTGSVFNMIGGTLTIVRGGSTTYNDLYLLPDSYSVTGGTVVFGNSSTETTNNYNTFSLNTIVPLNNLTIDGTTTSKTVTLAIHGLTLLGNLVINATSVFRADSNDVDIAGNLTNLNTDANTGINTGGYRPGSYNQLTTFNGTTANQTITGASGNVTNFANLVIYNTKSSGSVILQTNSNIRVNNDLALSKGTLADGGNVISVIGNISNSATHSGTGRIVLAGSAIQYLSGNGTGKFGNLYLNASKDVKMIADMEITGVLTFQTKLLDIGENLLKLSNTAAGATSGSSSTSYIKTDGLLSDAGVVKSFATGATDYTFPIGVTGKYTPARFNITANTAAGTINVVPVNAKHPSTTDPGEYQLVYYWHVLNTGFSGLTVSQYYSYVTTDIKGSESSYLAGRYYYGVWDRTTGAINRSLHQIQYIAVNFIFGDYTAGYSSEFANVSIFYSRDATMGGNWDNLNTWSTVSHSGPAATSYPNGQTAFIGSGHTVTANGNSRRTYVLTLEGTGVLDLGSTIGHDFGSVYGTGTIKLNPSTNGYYVFPAGNYSSFTSTAGGTIELYNTSGTAVFPYLTTYNKLTLSGTGNKRMIDADVRINGVFTNMKNSGFIASATGNLILCDNWVNVGAFNHMGGTIIFDGTTTISGNNTTVLHDIIINPGKILAAVASGTLGIEGNFVNEGTFTHNNGTIAFSGISLISGSSTTIFYNVTVSSLGKLYGREADNVIVQGNWVLNGNFTHNYGTITIDGNTAISGSKTTTFGNLIIDPGYTLTGPASGTMSVGLDFTNNGTFTPNGCTVIFSGEEQAMGGSSLTRFENIKVNDGSNVNINSAQSIAGYLLCNGTLNANSNLVLLSDATRTALILGTGTGDVLGSLTMQRYLSSSFGYKYVGSPFRASSVGEFADEVNLDYWFPLFYRYDESRFFSGWVKYNSPDGLLVPMQGYAANFGSETTPLTINISGEVNNNTLIPLTLFNNNRNFTKGFNLIGNPYPSPIDWNAASGWVKYNIDNALYYFNAGGNDMYTGTYATYVNGVSSDGKANNIIPSMQGVFIHVSNGTYPVAATLIFTNDIRVTNQSPLFHKESEEETRPLIRLTARMRESGYTSDPLVVYFEDQATMNFDSDLDALKLMNTDSIVPNLYAVSTDIQNLSIDAIPQPVDSLTVIPLTLSIQNKGMVIFKASDILNLPENIIPYLVDPATGLYQNLYLHPEYRIYLEAGTYSGRFSLVFSQSDLRYKPASDELFHAYSSRNRLFVYAKLDEGEKAYMLVYNMLGQMVYQQELTTNGYHEMDLDVNTGIYVISLKSPKGKQMKKVFINNQ